MCEVIDAVFALYVWGVTLNLTWFAEQKRMSWQNCQTNLRLVWVDHTMAGRRVALKALDWVSFAERIPANQRSMFNALKTRSDAISSKCVPAGAVWYKHPAVIFDCRCMNIVNADFTLLYMCLLLTRLNSLPPTPAVIDWSYYKTAVAKAGMVDEFEKKVNCAWFTIKLIIHLFKPWVWCFTVTHYSLIHTARSSFIPTVQGSADPWGGRHPDQCDQCTGSWVCKSNPKECFRFVSVPVMPDSPEQTNIGVQTWTHHACVSSCRP